MAADSGTQTTSALEGHVPAPSRQPLTEPGELTNATGEAPPQPPLFSGSAQTTSQDQNPLDAAFAQKLSLSSKAVHADDHINNHRAVAPPMHVSTTFRYNQNPDELNPGFNVDVSLTPEYLMHAILTSRSSHKPPTTHISTPGTRAPTRPA
jgi:hypothetical protein